MASQDNCCAPTVIYSKRAMRRDAKLFTGWDVARTALLCSSLRLSEWGRGLAQQSGRVLSSRLCSLLFLAADKYGTKFRDPLPQLCLSSVGTLGDSVGLPRLGRGAWCVFATRRVLLPWLINVPVSDPFNTPIIEYLYLNGMIFIPFAS